MRHVLIVDDSSLVHAMYESILSRIPSCKVTHAKNGSEALTAIDEHGVPNLMFLDVNMPVMDGLECLGQLKARGIVGTIPIVVVSTEGAEHDVARALDLGATEYLRKPFRRDQIEALLERRLSAVGT